MPAVIATADAAFAVCSLRASLLPSPAAPPGSRVRGAAPACARERRRISAF